MRQIVIEHYVDEEGNEYGRVVRPSEMVAMQEFAHEHVELITRDALMQGAVSAAVAGFAYALPGALSVSIAAGQAINPQGLNFESLPPGEATVVVLPAAHPTLPRIDVICVSLATDQDAENAPQPHRRLLSSVEQAQGAGPYSISNFNVPTQIHNRAVVAVLQGMAAGVPVAPAVGANQVALFQVRVEAAAVALTADKVTDVRPLLRSLHNAWTSLDALNQNPILTDFSEKVDDRVAALVADSLYLTRVYDDPGNVFTLDVDLSALDLRYLNATGDEHMAGSLLIGVDVGRLAPVKLAVGSAPSLDVTAGLKFQQVLLDDATSFDAGPVTGLAFLARANAAGALAGFGSIECGKENAVSSDVKGYLSFKTNGGGAAPERLRIASNGNVEMYSNLSVLGALTKGAGTFLIDHPLDPNNKNLRHGFVESPRYDLIYRGKIQMVGNGPATINVDAASGMSAGTFAALAGNAQVFLQNDTGFDLVRVAPGENVNSGVFDIELAGEYLNIEGDTISWLVIAERKDPYILADETTNDDGHMVVEFNKPPATPDDLRLLQDVPMTQSVTTETGDGGDVVEFEEVVHGLVGRVGFPMHAAFVGVGAIPKRSLIVTIVDTNEPVVQTALIDFSGKPADGDTVTVGGMTFTYRVAPAVAGEVAIGANPSGNTAAMNLRVAILNNSADTGCSATYNSADVSITLTANDAGVPEEPRALATSSSVIAVTPFS